MEYIVTRTFDTPITMHLDKVDAVEVFTKDHRPQLNEGEYHIVVNGQDALKYTYNKNDGKLYQVFADTEKNDEYNDEALNKNKELLDAIAADMKLTTPEREEKAKEAGEYMKENYPQRKYVIHSVVNFTYGDDMKSLLAHPALSSI